MTDKREIVNQARPWVKRTAHFGYAAKGMVYILVGVLAARAAVSAGQQAEGKGGALESLLAAPFGQIVLAVTVAGLLAYTLWRFVQSALDAENEGEDAEGIVKRVGFAASGLAYLALAGFSLRSLLNSSSSQSQGSGTQEVASTLMAQPLGRFLVGAAGIIAVGVGLYQFYRAYKAGFRDSIEGEHLWLYTLGRVGFGARGVVYLLIGLFFFRAAIDQQASEAGGLGQALRTLEAQPFGPWLLGTVALGLVAYGLYALCLARYRHIKVTPS